MGREIVRWGLDIVLAWIGAMKFTAHEAMGIQPLVAHSPFISCMYDFLSVRSFSAMLGCIEIGTAALLGLRSQSLDPVHQQRPAYLLDVSSTSGAPAGSWESRNGWQSLGGRFEHQREINRILQKTA